VHLNGDFRAGDSAKSASRAFSAFFLEMAFRKNDGGISLLVQPIKRLNQMMGTDRDAQFAVFAQFRVNFDHS
jgi:hypothetical protein